MRLKLIISLAVLVPFVVFAVQNAHITIVKFFGGQLAKRTHEQFPESACVLSIEFKKFFMDEWSGKPDQSQIQAISDALKFTIAGILEELYK